MTGRVAEDKIAEVRERTSIVEIISRYTALKRTGRNHQGLCPFHSEKTPSFSVSEDRGLFYCFGCQASGDVFKFVMLKDNLTFPEALERLAREAGIELPKRPADERREQGRERLFRVNTFAAKYFQRALWESPAGAAAREYLVKRNIREETARAFGIGYAPPEGLAGALENAKAPMADAEALGLVARSTRGPGWFDRFRGRLMFPITDLAGKTIAFGGRLLGEGEGAKYINSSETPLFQKRRSLFGLAAARDAIHAKGRVVVVEGYIDVIALAQAGVRNVVAPLGTALTADQIRVLKRFTESFVVLFDGDRAGIAAAARSFAAFAEIGIFADAAFLPEGHDPDTFVNQSGAAAVEELFTHPSPLVDHYLRSLAPPEGSLAARAAAARSVAELCERLEDPVFVGLLRRHGAEYLSLPEEQLRGKAQTRHEPAAPRPAPPPAAARIERFSAEELRILELLLVEPTLARNLPDDVDVLFVTAGARAMLGEIRGAQESSSVGDFVKALPRDAADRVAKAWNGDREPYSPPEQMLDDCVKKLRLRARDARRRALTQEIREAESRGDEATYSALVEEKRRLDAGASETKSEETQ